MVAPIELAYTAPVALSPITNLHSLPDGNIWHSGEYNDPSPSNQAIRISYSIVLGITPASGDRLDFWIAQGDEAVSSEIWDGGMSASEGRISTAATIAATLSALRTPTHTHEWQANLSTTLSGSFDVWDFGPSWQLCIRVVSNTIASIGSVVRYRYLTPAMSTDFETTVSITRDASGAVARTLQDYIDDTVFSPEDFGAVASDTGTHTAAFQAAIAAAALTNGIIGIPAGTWELDADMTIQGLIAGYATIISPASGRTITIGTIQAPCDTRLFSSTGSIVITRQRPVYAEWFGAVADNATDCTSALTRACNCQAELTGYVQLLHGSYRISNNVVSTSRGIRFIGAGFTNTSIVSTHATANDLAFQSEAARVEVAHLKFAPAVTKTGGSYIYITGGASGVTGNSFSYVHNVDMSLGFRGLFFDKSATFRVENCRFTSVVTVGITVENQITPDAGDSTITGCTFNGTNTGSVGVRQLSSGGLKISDCKFLGCQRQYVLDLANGAHTGQILFSNCSMEGFTETAIYLNRATGINASWRHVVVNGCFFGLANGTSAIVITDQGPANWISNVDISGNIFHNIGFTFNGSVAIDIHNGFIFNISGNIFTGATGSVNSHGIRVAAAATNGRASNNIYTDVAVPFASSSLSFIHEPDTYNGSTTWNPESLTAGTISNATTVTVAGAAVGDIARASLSTLTTQNVNLHAVVSAAGTVTVRAKNESAGTIDLASGTLRAIVHHLY